ncbi:hypothetical protein BLNAU_17595 [Blattamonas nauphoetae]|uniref:Protein kinase domain-containing protein n=1 Tax=Blattamonas nauphoetae TaxID=2049346 RepID=A0ABQ9X6Z3_9EUKA|nr:hypothetical protein BLNAU_17595 [Blattamonas nauphoetae]
MAEEPKVAWSQVGAPCWVGNFVKMVVGRNSRTARAECAGALSKWIAYFDQVEDWIGLHLFSINIRTPTLAVKILALDSLRSSSMEGYARTEGATLHYIRHGLPYHPNIIQTYEVVEDNEALYIVMEFLSGGELLQRILKCKDFSQDDAVLISPNLPSQL